MCEYVCVSRQGAANVWEAVGAASCVLFRSLCLLFLEPYITLDGYVTGALIPAAKKKGVIDRRPLCKLSYFADSSLRFRWTALTWYGSAPLCISFVKAAWAYIWCRYNYNLYIYNWGPWGKNRKWNLGVTVWGVIIWKGEDNRERTSCCVFSTCTFLRAKTKHSFLFIELWGK